MKETWCPLKIICNFQKTFLSSIPIFTPYSQMLSQFTNRVSKGTSFGHTKHEDYCFKTNLVSVTFIIFLIACDQMKQKTRMYTLFLFFLK